MSEEYGNIENVKLFDRHTFLKKKWVPNLNIVYAPSVGVYRVKYNDCRLPVSIIIKELNKYNYSKLSITEKENSLFLICTIHLARYDLILKNFEKFSKLHNLKYFLHFSTIGQFNNTVGVRIKLDDYKNITSSYMRSIRSIDKFNL